MSRFQVWCKIERKTIDAHRLELLEGKPCEIEAGVEAVARSVPQHYVSPERISHVLRCLGKTKAATVLDEKLPIAKRIRSGDLGEILCTNYVTEMTEFDILIYRLRWKDHRDMSMRGEDIIAIKFDHQGRLELLKGEAKSNKTLSNATISNARETLQANNGRPSPHALAFLADRLFESGKLQCSDQIDRIRLHDKISLSQMSHLLFTFSGNNPRELLQEVVELYTGEIKQLVVGLQVDEHEMFVEAVYEKVLVDGPKQ